MHLRRLELHGFKSFALKTTLTFDDGVTCIVGPNGCGKSNIVDAVRWAVGEQRARALRSETMGGVIFNGTSRRRAVGMAEVLLTVENSRGILPTEYAHVTLGRRFYRSGEGEYLLNGVTCRLRDIQDLFMDTGMGAGAYSIIELAKVEQLLSDSADDRRRLFEEAAGITKFKLRRRQALGKLDGAQQDLTRLRDLVDEVAAQASALQRQARKAARWRELDERRQVLERHVALAEWDRLTAALEQHASDLQAAEDAARRAEADVTAREAERERAETDRVAREDARRSAQAALQAHLDAQRAAHAEARIGQERHDRAWADARRLAEQADRLDARLTGLTERRDQLAADLEAARPAAGEALRALSEATQRRDDAQRAVDTARLGARTAADAERAAAHAQADAQAALDRASAREELHAAEADRLRASAPPADDETARTRIAHAHAALERAEAAAADAHRASEAAEAASAQRLDDLRAASAELREAQAALSAHASQADVLRRLLAATRDTEGVRVLVERASREGRALPTVDDLVAPLPGWEHAVAAALSGWRDAVVVPDEAVAQAALRTLREHGKGRATVLVESVLPSGGGSPGPDALASCVTVPEAHRALAATLLSGWRIADVLPDPSEVPPGVRIVDREGAWVGAPLVATDQPPAARWGGAPSEGAPPPSRAEQRSRLDALDARTPDLEGVADRAQARVARLQEAEPDDRAALRAQAGQADRDVRAARQTLDRLRLERESAETARREHAARLDREQQAAREAGRVLPELRERAGAAQAALADARADVQAADARAQQVEADGREAFDAFTAASLAAAQTQARLDALAAELERATQSARDTAEQRDRDRREAQTQREAASEQEREARAAAEHAERLALEREPLDAAVEQAESAVLDAGAATSDADERLRAARRAQAQASERMSAVAVAQAQVQARRDALEEDWAESHDAPLADQTDDVPGDFDASAARAELSDVKARIGRIGPVNALAVEDYQAASERLAFLEEQQRDLEEAEALLEETIAEIDTAASERFAATFAQIQASFQTLFADLFGAGASAELTLARPDDLLESPVEVFARPSGKRPASIGQLSGGEKTLTAIALLFAIYLVKPSPFCILDEVDAPLDEANVDRFMRLIRRFSEQTQFILVTHNKRTMELSDRLYGVTMQEPGISKLVSVRFDEAAELVG